MKHYELTKKKIRSQDIDVILGLPVGTTRIVISNDIIDIQIPDSVQMTVVQKTFIKNIFPSMTEEKEYISDQ